MFRFGAGGAWDDGDLHQDLSARQHQGMWIQPGIIPDSVVFPNFGQWTPYPNFVIYKIYILQMKNNVAIIVNGLSAFKLFQLSNGD